MLALCRAAAEYRPDAGTAFSTFASACILNAIWRALGGRRYRWQLAQLPADADGIELDQADHRHLQEPGALGDVGRLLRVLPGRHRQAVVLRYGLDGGGERTLKQVAGALRVSRERARQLVAAAVARLRRAAGQPPDAAGEAAAASPSAAVPAD
jgi:RNA polymerase sigma factor (sigma-70 family)